MIVSDMHTHSTFSTDGRAPLDEMISTGKNLGLKYYGVTEHFDLDEYSIKLYGTIDEAAYFARARELQKRYNSDRFTFLAGGEFNYVTDEAVFEKFIRVSETYRPDFVVNSVHIVDGEECYRHEYFAGKSKHYAYSRYLEQVLKSLDAPYKFDIVGHLGYVSRNAPYEDKKINYADFSDLYDAILKKLIDKNIILEVNSQSRGAGSDFLPDTDVLRRYFELGGRAISFGSDAHFPSRVAEKRDTVCAALKGLGFTYITVPDKGKRIAVDI
ncbi:MAG: histidinol-phosphatase HisJ family protein [Clostridiales bacterium]|nr:histidinol-phosphatase HisJ family protein [Clostridiales bacterium]